MNYAHSAGEFLKDEKPSFLHVIRSLFNRALIEQQVQFADVSFYQGVIDWDRMATKAPAAIIRAGQNTWVDSQFSRNYAEAKRVGMQRGVYWFYDDRTSPITQANILVSLLANNQPEMEIFIDWEITYNGPYFGLDLVVDMMQEVERRLPGATVGMYTGYYWFRDNSSPSQHAAEYAYLKDKPLWLAWYTSNPAYVQIPAPWTKLTHWQWGTPAWGFDWGVDSAEIDMNWFNGTQAEFEQRYGDGGTVPPPAGGDMETIVYSNGVRINTGRQFDSDVQVIETPRASIQAINYVYERNGAVVTALDGDIVMNFTPFNTSTLQPNLGLRISGSEIEPYHNYNPYMAWTSDKTPVLTHVAKQFKNYADVSQGFRYIIENGVKNPNANANADWDPLEPRQLIGKTPGGDTIIISVKGRQPIQRGISLHEACAIGLQYGCDMMMDVDSGSSVQTMTRFLDGSTEVFNGVAALNSVVVFLAISLKEPLDNGGTTPPPIDPIAYFKSYDADDNELDTWIRQ